MTAHHRPPCPCAQYVSATEVSLTANQAAAKMRARRLRWTAAPSPADDAPQVRVPLPAPLVFVLLLQPCWANILCICVCICIWGFDGWRECALWKTSICLSVMCTGLRHVVVCTGPRDERRGARGSERQHHAGCGRAPRACPCAGATVWGGGGGAGPMQNRTLLVTKS